MRDHEIQLTIQEIMADATGRVELAKSYATIISEANRQLEYLMDDFKQEESE